MIFVRPSSRLLCAGLLLVACAQFGGCTFFRNYGSGTHLDSPREKTQKKFTAKAATMQFEVLTDAAGQVVQVQFIRSSGSNAVDNYVANSARENLAGAASTRSVYEINYTPNTGFSNPKLLSSSPTA